jgi:hypothetical protein
MAASRNALVALLGIALAACGAEAASVSPATHPTGVAQATPPPVTATPAVTSEQEPSTESPTRAATPKPTSKPTPKPTPVPVPPKLSGLGYDRPSELEGGGLASLTWKAPRTKGVEIRVYGVTRCLPGVDGACLQEHTALADDIRVLLAKAPASKGKVSWNQDWGDWVSINDPDWACTTAYVSENGTSFYSIVVAAYSTSGHSIFAIVDPGWLGEADVCPA